MTDKADKEFEQGFDDFFKLANDLDLVPSLLNIDTVNLHHWAEESKVRFSLVDQVDHQPIYVMNLDPDLLQFLQTPNIEDEYIFWGLAFNLEHAVLQSGFSFDLLVSQRLYKIFTEAAQADNVTITILAKEDEPRPDYENRLVPKDHLYIKITLQSGNFKDFLTSTFQLLF